MAADNHPLAEIPEREARGEIRDIYSDLKRHVGLVALIYRHLATIPGALDWAWRVLRPAYESGAMDARARRVRSAVDVGPARGWAAFGASVRDDFAPDDVAGIGRVLDAYNLANPCNIVGVLALGRVLGAERLATKRAGGADDDPAPNSAAPPQDLPPVVAIGDLGPDLKAAIAGLASRGVTDTDTIVPTLYRHLANWPRYMADAAQTLHPMFESGDIEAMARVVYSRADVEAEALYAGLADLPDLRDNARAAVMSALDMFVRRIPEMTVVGVLLRASLPGPAHDQDPGVDE